MRDDGSSFVIRKAPQATQNQKEDKYSFNIKKSQSSVNLKNVNLLVDKVRVFSQKQIFMV